MKQTVDFEDKIFDDLLTDAMQDLCPEADALASEDIPEPSAAFRQSMNAMFREEEKKLRRKHFYRRMPRIAAVLALFVVLALITVNTTSAWKEPLYNFFFRSSEDGETSKVNINELDEDMEKYLPEYVPEGFELVENNYNNDTTQWSIHYENNDSYFIIFIVNNEEDLYTDISSFSSITYNHKTYYTNNNDTIVWCYNNHYYFILSNLDKTEVLKIADSIK